MALRVTVAELELIEQALLVAAWHVDEETSSAMCELAGYLTGGGTDIVTTVCEVCGQEFKQYRPRRRAQYCSRACAQRAYRERVRARCR